MAAWLHGCSGASATNPAGAAGQSGFGGSSSGGSSSGSGGSSSGSGGSSSGGSSSGSGGSSSSGSGGSSGGGSSSSGSSGGGSSGGGGGTTGGALATGGSRATGGAPATGGTKSTGGFGTGGLASTGGTRASGGAKSTGGAGGTSCPYSGHVTYSLTKSSNPTAAEQSAYALITTAMDKAVAFYNCYTNITKAENVSYNTSVSTADGNINGSIRFGASTTYMDYRTAMHEISHTVGIGQVSNWSSFIQNGLFTGSNAVAQLAAINATLVTPLYTELHADTQHFWPYGINQQSEVKSETDWSNIIGHCQMVMAIRKDLGLN